MALLFDEIKNYQIYLASQSPRRRELLSGMGFQFEVMSMHVPEIHPENMPPAQVVEYLSQLKLSTVDLEKFPDNCLFIACDTIVVLGDEIIEKPKNEADALRMLRELSGQEHTVMSGVTLLTKKKKITQHAESQVKFREFSNEEILYYIQNYQPFDKAGAYGIQEWMGYVGIEYIHGSFYNVMGLPTCLLWQMLQKVVKN
ncbi:MAG: Maf family protein [Bacteroidales bacterium]|nr:Maf family protein [Bacteroidales bacterium]